MAAQINSLYRHFSLHQNTPCSATVRMRLNPIMISSERQLPLRCFKHGVSRQKRRIRKNHSWNYYGFGMEGCPGPPGRRPKLFPNFLTKYQAKFRPRTLISYVLKPSEHFLPCFSKFFHGSCKPFTCSQKTAVAENSIKGVITEGITMGQERNRHPGIYFFEF